MFESIGMFLSKVKCFSAYVDNAEGFPKPLTKEEETYYMKKYKEEGDMSARDTLITRNLRLVPHVVKKYTCSNIVEADDMISTGSLGLIKAVDSFDHTRGVKFATYASRCIQNEVLMLIRTNKKHKDNISLESPVSSDANGDDEILLMDMIADEEDDITERLNNSFILEEVQDIINRKLSPREKQIVIKRFGLDGDKIMTQKELAKEIGISRSYISRIENKSIETIKENINPNFFEKN